MRRENATKILTMYDVDGILEMISQALICMQAGFDRGSVSGSRGKSCFVVDYSPVHSSSWVCHLL